MDVYRYSYMAVTTVFNTKWIVGQQMQNSCGYKQLIITNSNYKNEWYKLFIESIKRMHKPGIRGQSPDRKTVFEEMLI